MTDAIFEPLGLDRNRLSRLMREHDLNGLLLTSPEHVFYTTGYPALPSSGNPILYALRNVLPFFAFIDDTGRSALICWGGAAAGVNYGVDEVLTFADMGGAISALKELLGVRFSPGVRWAIESSCPYSTYRLVHGIAGEPALADDLMTALRLIKSPREIAFLEKSTQVVEQTVADLMDRVYVGMSRPELMQAARVGMMKYGASGIDHVTVSFGASNPEVEIDEQLLPGKLVTLDLGAIVNGYISDNRRLMYTGEVPAAMRRLHDTMCNIVEQVGAALLPGRTFGEVFDFAMSLYAKHDLKPFIPNIGHTMGLQVEEVWLYKDSPIRLEPGMVLNIEMYALYETGELIGDEETYVIEADGPRLLTNLPRPIRAMTK